MKFGWGRVGLVVAGLAVAVTAAIAGVYEQPAAAATDTDLFVDEFVSSLRGDSIAGDWLPDGRLLVLTRRGAVQISDPQTGATRDHFTIADVGVTGERGSLDLVLDPNFGTNSYFYVYHATQREPAALRITRFTLNESNSTATANSRTLIWENPGKDHDRDFHIGGSLNISNDGKLLLSIGDGFIAQQSSDVSNVFGSIVRVNLDGSIPDDNPYVGRPGLDDVYASGLRNPFRGWVDPVTGEYWIGDVGGNTASQAYEEINLITAGGNYGWPACEGPLIKGPSENGPNCPAGTSGPWFSYDHDNALGCCLNRSITLGEKYRGGRFPSEFNEAFIYGDWADNSISWVETNADGTSGAGGDFPAIENSRPIWISVGPDGSVYYIRLDFFTGHNELRRLRFTGSVEQPPVISSTSASTQSGPVPLSVDFSGVADDPDGDPVTYLWDFGDGNTSTAPNPTHVYTTSGNFSAMLTVTAGGEVVAAPPITVEVGTPPTVEIQLPIDGSSFRAGDTLDLQAQGADTDGALDSNSYAWSVALIHDDHEHNRFQDEPGQAITWQVPTVGHDYRGTTGLAIRVSVTDADGLTATDEVRIYPEKVDLTFDNSLGQGTIIIDGETSLVPFVLDTLVGFNHSIETQSQVCTNVGLGAFDQWADGTSTATRAITTPAASRTFFAEYSGNQDCAFVVRARGTTGEEHLEVRVGGQVFGEFDVTTSFADYEVDLPSGTLIGEVQVAFTNDLSRNGVDRNLIVDYVDLGGARFETEAESTTSTGTFNQGTGCAPSASTTSETLHCNGHFVYSGPGVVLNPPPDDPPVDDPPVDDVVDPVGVATSPGDGSSSPAGEYEVSGTAFDEGSGVERVLAQVRTVGVSPTLFWNGSEFAPSTAGSFRGVSFNEATGEWRLPFVDLSAAGTYEVRVNVRDNAGNVATSAENPGVRFTITDDSDPVGVATSPGDGSVNDPGVYDVSGTAFDEGSGVRRVLVQVRTVGVSPTLFWSGSEFSSSATGSFRSVSFDQVTGVWTLPDIDFSAAGTYEVRVNVRDNAGNVATSSENVGIRFVIE